MLTHDSRDVPQHGGGQHDVEMPEQHDVTQHRADQHGGTTSDEPQYMGDHFFFSGLQKLCASVGKQTQQIKHMQKSLQEIREQV